MTPTPPTAPIRGEEGTQSQQHRATRSGRHAVQAPSRRRSRRGEGRRGRRAFWTRCRRRMEASGYRRDGAEEEQGGREGAKAGEKPSTRSSSSRFHCDLTRSSGSPSEASRAHHPQSQRSQRMGDGSHGEAALARSHERGGAAPGSDCDCPARADPTGKFAAVPRTRVVSSSLNLGDLQDNEAHLDVQLHLRRSSSSCRFELLSSATAAAGRKR